MIARTTIPGLGTATQCVASGSHAPDPSRYVWHHVQPESCGGPTNRGNCIETCDSCHYTIHRMLYAMARATLMLPIPPTYIPLLEHPPRRAQLMYAKLGYDRCNDAGTLTKVPNEG
jgi:hypothetical protein